MKNIFFISLLIVFNSCQAQRVEDTINTFNQNRQFFDSLAIFIETHKGELGVNHENQAIFIDKSLLYNPKYQNVHKEKIKSFFYSNLFNQVSIYEQGNIEFLIDFQSDNLLKTETKKYYMYTSEKKVPNEYNNWAKKVPIDTNWWYLEYTDAHY